MCIISVLLITESEYRPSVVQKGMSQNYSSLDFQRIIVYLQYRVAEPFGDYRHIIEYFY
jgi:hypothetical protein